jgi:predicted nucleic acid-binding protein
MIVVSDTSALSALFLVDKLDLLPVLYGQVVVPPAVMREILQLEIRFGHDLSGLKTAPWLSVIPVSDLKKVQDYQRVLDEGESEAIVLIMEISADLLLIDEIRGRKVAQSEGILYTGVLGVLLSAKYKGLLNVVRPVLDNLRKDTNFRISQKLYDFVLEQAGE